MLHRIKLFTLNLLLFFSHNIIASNTNQTLEVTQISKNVFSIIAPEKGLPNPMNKGWNSNVHFIITNNGVLLFDTGSSEALGNQIKNAIKTVTDQPVKWIVNSHSHADHWLGNNAFSLTIDEIISSKSSMENM